jgi:hypothetical protein
MLHFWLRIYKKTKIYFKNNGKQNEEALTFPYISKLFIIEKVAAAAAAA